MITTVITLKVTIENDVPIQPAGLAELLRFYLAGAFDKGTVTVEPVNAASPR
jgi:hypothetical protein